MIIIRFVVLVVGVGNVCWAAAPSSRDDIERRVQQFLQNYPDKDTSMKSRHEESRFESGSPVVSSPSPSRSKWNLLRWWGSKDKAAVQGPVKSSSSGARKLLNADLATSELRFERIELPVVQQASPHRWPEGRLLGASSLNWDNVAMGESGNCGYHALNNVLSLIAQLKTQDDLDLDQLLRFESYKDFMAFMAPRIAQKRTPSKDLSWLDGAELESLYAVLKNVSPYAGTPVLIIEHVPVRGLEFSEHVLKTIQNFVRNSSGLLSIIWNSGVRYALNTAGGVHWVGFVVERKGGNTRLYYMNSIEGMDPDFRVVESLLKSTPEQLQKLIDGPAQQEMHRGIERMKFNLEILKQKDTSKVFSQYIGCIADDGPFVLEFTPEHLHQLGSSFDYQDIDLLAFNKRWKRSLAGKSQDALRQRALRFYGIWRNPNTGAIQAFDATVRNCDQMAIKYSETWLVDKVLQKQIFDPVLVFESMLHTCLVTWKDYRKWPSSVQREIAQLLKEYAAISLQNPEIIVAVDWTPFGGFDKAIRDVVAKMPVISLQGPAYGEWVESFLQEQQMGH